MIRANRNDKDLIIDILTQSFQENKSVNYIIKQDKKRIERIKRLMAYSFEVCFLFGEVHLSDDKKGCALIIYPDKKRTNLKHILLDLQLMIYSLGLNKVKRALQRETKIKKLHPQYPITYLWFIGVLPDKQGKGIGTNILTDVITRSRSQQRSIYLETSTLKNLPWYQKLGFTIYHELDFGYRLYCLRKE